MHCIASHYTPPKGVWVWGGMLAHEKSAGEQVMGRRFAGSNRIETFDFRAYKSVGVR